jgi:hypothetical protein
VDIRIPNIWVWDCNRTAPQTWTVLSDGRLSASGGTVCLAPIDDSATAGTTIAVSTCSGTDKTQIWRQQTNSTIVNIASGLCLSADALGYTSPFTLQPCQATSAQQWTLPTAS